MATIPTPEMPLGQVVESRRWETFGFTGGSVTGLAVVVLSIIGLAGLASVDMLAISAIVLGAGMLLEGGVAAAAFSRVHSYGRLNRPVASTAVGGELSGEALAGIAAIVLGALALIGVAPLVLTSIAAIVLGVGVLLGCGVMSRLNSIKMQTQPYVGLEATGATTLDAIKSTVDAEVMNGMEALAGVAAIVLGILALVGIAPSVLALVALLTLGAGTMLGGLFASA